MRPGDILATKGHVVYASSRDGGRIASGVINLGGGSCHEKSRFVLMVLFLCYFLLFIHIWRKTLITVKREVILNLHYRGYFESNFFLTILCQFVLLSTRWGFISLLCAIPGCWLEGKYLHQRPLNAWYWGNKAFRQTRALSGAVAWWRADRRYKGWLYLGWKHFQNRRLADKGLLERREKTFIRLESSNTEYIRNETD